MLYCISISCKIFDVVVSQIPGYARIPAVASAELSSGEDGKESYHPKALARSLMLGHRLRT